jgi:hypothetical protein
MSETEPFSKATPTSLLAKRQVLAFVEYTLPTSAKIHSARHESFHSLRELKQNGANCLPAAFAGFLKIHGNKSGIKHAHLQLLVTEYASITREKSGKRRIE